LNEELVATLERPPWEAEIVVPPLGEPAFLAVAAFYDDGARVEDVRYLNVPKNLSQLEVNLVELYTSVSDKSGRPIEGLGADDFTVLDEGKPQKIDKFELVRDLPLTLGVVIDTSGSMQVSMAEAKRAAKDFLDSVLTPRDRCFAVAFADKPVLLMSPTSDLGALEAALDAQTAYGGTALHDALLVSLYYFRGVAGKKALVLLSDGDDTASAAPYRDALEYARRSGVSIYTIGLQVPATNIAVRRHLRELAEETGGQSFMIGKASELAETYEKIERELRSQYLLAFLPDPAPPPGKYRLVEVRIKDGSLRARTMRGYLP
jgi:VWFA-related protein